MISLQENDTLNHDYKKKKDLLQISKVISGIIVFFFIITFYMTLDLYKRKPADRNDDILVNINNIEIMHNQNNILYNLTWIQSGTSYTYCLMNRNTFIGPELVMNFNQLVIFYTTCELVTNENRPWENFQLYVAIMWIILLGYIFMLFFLFYKMFKLSSELKRIESLSNHVDQLQQPEEVVTNNENSIENNNI